MQVRLGCSRWFYWHGRGKFYPETIRTASRLTSITQQLDPAFRNAVYRKFRERGLIFCSVSAPRLPDELIKTSDVLYARLHGLSRWSRHDRSTEELIVWEDRFAARDARDAWIYFDNDRDAFAIKTARELAAHLRQRGVEVS